MRKNERYPGYFVRPRAPKEASGVERVAVLAQEERKELKQGSLEVDKQGGER